MPDITADTVFDHCKHCGNPIQLGPPTPEPYWFHPHSQSVYCWQASDRLEERSVRAAPGG